MGYLEAKDIGVPLDDVESGEQLRRYRESLANLILTDYLEFRWYVGGEHRLTIRLAKLDKVGKLKLDASAAEAFIPWRIEQTGYGILALVTNHTYLDGLTHRRMRESLLQTFDDIYLLDLHGNSKKKEKAPDGGKDENVFDIQQGVAIGIFVKRSSSPRLSPVPPFPKGGLGGISRPRREGSPEKSPLAPLLQRGEHGSWPELAAACQAVGGGRSATVRHAELWGSRESKYERLYALDMATTPWRTLTPAAPHFFFAPRNFDLAEEYEAGWSLTDIFPVKQNGIKTDRDDLFFNFKREQLSERMKSFYGKAGLDPDFRERYRVENVRYEAPCSPREPAPISGQEAGLPPLKKGGGGDFPGDPMRPDLQIPPTPLWDKGGTEWGFTKAWAEGGRVWINATQYCAGVPPDVWNFHVGGYQVAQKWLKDRKGRPLSYDDLTHYQQVLAALAETIQLQARIDEAIGKWPVR